MALVHVTTTILGRVLSTLAVNLLVLQLPAVCTMLVLSALFLGLTAALFVQVNVAFAVMKDGMTVMGFVMMTLSHNRPPQMGRAKLPVVGWR